MLRGKSEPDFWSCLSKSLTMGQEGQILPQIHWLPPAFFWRKEQLWATNPQSSWKMGDQCTGLLKRSGQDTTPSIIIPFSLLTWIRKRCRILCNWKDLIVYILNVSWKKWLLTSQNSVRHAELIDCIEAAFFYDKTPLVPNTDGTIKRRKGSKFCSQALGDSCGPQLHWPTPVSGKNCRTGKGLGRSKLLSITLLSSLCHCPASGSASLVHHHALLHILLSRSLRHEVNINCNIHPFLWELAEGWRRARRVRAVASGRVKN